MLIHFSQTRVDPLILKMEEYLEIIKSKLMLGLETNFICLPKFKIEQMHRDLKYFWLMLAWLRGKQIGVLIIKVISSRLKSSVSMVHQLISLAPLIFKQL